MTELGQPDPRVEQVIGCEGCYQYRGCAKYRGMWICLAKCWRKRERLWTNRHIAKQRKEAKDEEEATGKTVHRHRKRPRAGKHSGSGAHYRR